MALNSSRNKYCKRNFFLYIIMIATAIMGFILSDLPVQCGDALRYAYIFPDDYYADFEGKIRTLRDIFYSQINHWHTVNGRFPVHFVIQIFCSLLPQWLFATFNGAAWSVLFYILMCFSRINRHSFCMLSLALLIYIIVLLPLSCDIPVQVNYVWTAAIVFGWLYIFLSGLRSIPHTKVGCVVFIIWSIIAGACHEGFSIPVCITLVAYMISSRRKISAIHTAGAVAFIIGTLSLILSPGNYIRFKESALTAFSLLNGIEQTFPAFILPLAIIFALSICHKIRKKILNEPVAVFLILIAIACLAMSLLLKFKFGVRGIFPVSVVAAILCMMLLKYLPAEHLCIYAAFSWITIIAATCIKAHAITEDNRIYTEIERQYRLSETGTVLLPDKDYLKGMPLTKDRALALEQTARSINSNAPAIKLLPTSINSLKPDRDSNIIYEFQPQAWILIQSKEMPDSFLIEKTILPGILDMHSPPRIVDFNDITDIAVDTTGNFRVAIYYNRRPYIKSEINSMFNFKRF